MNISYRKTRYLKYDIRAYIIWVTKYRYKVLVEGIEEWRGDD
jgi:REP element-mobilizing transposase RayT